MLVAWAMHLGVFTVRERVCEPEGMRARFRIALVQEYRVGGAFFSGKFQLGIA
jgi:hypothetical protein